MKNSLPISFKLTFGGLGVMAIADVALFTASFTSSKFLLATGWFLMGIGVTLFVIGSLNRNDPA